MPIEPSSNEIYRFRRGLRTMMPNPNEVHFRVGTWTGPILSFSDDEASGTLARFVAAVRTERPLAETIASFSQAEGEQFVAFLDLLLDQKLLEVSGHAAHDPELHAGVSTWMNYVSRAPREDLDRLRATRIAIVGAGLVGSRFALQAATMGVKAIHVLDSRALGEDDVRGSAIFAKSQIGLPRAEALVEALQQRFPAVAFSWATMPERAGYAKAFAAVDHVVTALDQASPLLWRDINEYALAERKPWSMVGIDGFDGYIGPSFLPHESPCYTCVEYRLRHNLRSRDSYDLFVKDAGHGNGAPPVVLPAMADVVAGLMAAQLPHIVAGVGTPYASVLNFSFLESSFGAEQVLRLPRCPSCGPAARGIPPATPFGPSVSVLLDPRHVKQGSAGRPAATPAAGGRP